MSKKPYSHPFLETVNSYFPILFPISIILSGLAFVSYTRFLQVQQQIERLPQYPSRLPEGYEIGVWDHGTFIKWFTIKEQPILFGLSIILMVIPYLLLFLWFLWGWGWVLWDFSFRDLTKWGKRK